MRLLNRIDSRLLGTWRSEGERTSAELFARPDFTDAQKAKLSSLFGRLELRYTRRYYFSSFEGIVSRHRYRVLGSDAESVAIISGGDIHHIHFDGDSYWMTLGRSNVREFFRRVV